LDGKVAVVTGGGRSIGAAISRRLAREGATVVVAQRSEDEARVTADEIGSAGGRAMAIKADVASESSVAQMMEQVLQDHGKVDILVNNAGVGVVESVLDMTMENYDAVMDVNVRGLLLCTKYAGRAMTTAGSGCIINLASVNGMVGFPNITVYNASKGAVLAITRQTALDLGPHGVRVNAISPGYIDNPMMRAYCDAQPKPEGALAAAFGSIPLGRFGSEEDIAGGAAYLASDDAKWVTGTTLLIDGGSLCHGPVST
jgi:NAD(P)-dependent dehydrogenase (short-subunit alcohol dehydrogenase family)